MKPRRPHAWAALVTLAGAGAILYATWPSGRTTDSPGNTTWEKAVRPHTDHAAFFPDPITSPFDVTAACLRCHPQSGEQVLKTAHWQWLGPEVAVPGHEGTHRIGKKNLLNNFCLSTIGNRESCTKCHVGYGWKDDTFDFSKAGNIDCLVCHEHAGTYVKGDAGLPMAGVDLRAAAQSVGWPRRENCSVCHSYGGGGQGVKHGDIDSSLENPSPSDDVHMGRLGMVCTDCHRTVDHAIRGRAFSVSVENANGIACEDCHRAPPHADPRLNDHLSAVACQTCHIPTYARRLPTKTFWDWSKGGDPNRPEDPHRYLKIKGEFVYDQDLVPEYFWFNRTVARYLLGDPIDPEGVTDINRPRGSITDRAARITPFKVHRALQPYDRERKVLLPPILSGEGGFWKEFDWNKALTLGAEAAGIAFSGAYGFAKTTMYWPLSHMVAPAASALHCRDCHGKGTRLDWKALGYDGDPIVTGGRR